MAWTCWPSELHCGPITVHMENTLHYILTCLWISLILNKCSPGRSSKQHRAFRNQPCRDNSDRRGTLNSCFVWRTVRSIWSLSLTDPFLPLYICFVLVLLIACTTAPVQYHVLSFILFNWSCAASTDSCMLVYHERQKGITKIFKCSPAYRFCQEHQHTLWSPVTRHCSIHGFFYVCSTKPFISQHRANRQSLLRSLSQCFIQFNL